LYYACMMEDKPTARQAFVSLCLEINYLRGQRYLGSFIGSAQRKEEWLGESVSKWVTAVKTLSIVTERYPQNAYAGFTFRLQNKWQYVQQVVANTAPFFVPLEAEICTSFLPALFGIPLTEINGGYHQLLTLGIKQGGLAICNPVYTTPSNHLASRAATHHLAVSLVGARAQFNLGTHCHCATKAGQAVKKARLVAKLLFLNRNGWDNPSVARWDNLNCAAGAWLSVFPNLLNGTGLSADEWRDNICLRYNRSPLNMPAACNGCRAKMLVKHALSCKVCSLVHI
jgi:hypothetical protein